MNRRDFLRMLGIGAATVAAPKFIFDMGKNSRLYTPVDPYEVRSIHCLTMPKDIAYLINLSHIEFNRNMAAGLFRDGTLLKLT